MKMKINFYYFTLICTMLLIGCTDSQAVAPDYSPSGPLKSFRLSLTNKIYHATINDTENTGVINGIEYGGYVTDVAYELESGATISPEPAAFVRNWPGEAKFTVTSGSEIVEYTIVLPQYLGKDPSDGDKEQVIFFTDFDESDGIPDANVWSLCAKGESVWNRNMSGSYDQAYVENGNLVLKAEVVDGAYKTGGVESIDKKSFRNARIDIYAKIDNSAKGGFPALWLMPQTPIYSGWPNGGEIDIMEQLNHDSFVYQTIHNKYKNILGYTDPNPDITKEYNVGEYNTYSVEMTDEELIFFVNDEKTFSYPNLHLADEAEMCQWPFSTDFYLILNFAVGGADTWPGVIDDTQLPATMSIDWIKVTELTPKTTNQVVMGYMSVDDWQYSAQFGKINWKHLTHILPSFGRVKADGSIDTRAMDLRINEIKITAAASGVKTLASFISFESGSFESAIQNDATRDLLAKNIVNYVKKHDLAGFDIDYEEYSNLEANIPNLLKLFAKLQELKGDDMLMTCAVNPGGWLDYGTEWHTYFDYINLMSYDSFGGSDRPTQHASYEDYVADIYRWSTRNGAPLSKLVGGLPFYGYSWDDIPGVDDSKGIRFYSIIEYYKDFPEVKDNDQIGNTYYNGRNTIRRKCEYAKDNELGGVMVWQLFQDAKDAEDKLLKVVGEVILEAK